MKFILILSFAACWKSDHLPINEKNLLIAIQICSNGSLVPPRLCLPMSSHHSPRDWISRSFRTLLALWFILFLSKWDSPYWRVFCCLIDTDHCRLLPTWYGHQAYVKQPKIILAFKMVISHCFLIFIFHLAKILGLSQLNQLSIRVYDGQAEE
jgi:hypothetical protein